MSADGFLTPCETCGARRTEYVHHTASYGCWVCGERTASLNEVPFEECVRVPLTTFL